MTRRLLLTTVLIFSLAGWLLAGLIASLEQFKAEQRERNKPLTESELWPEPPRGDDLWLQMTKPELRAQMKREDL